MVRLSVNINKFATLRNARGKNNPDIIKIAQDCERFGAQGITVHPRPDERHIRYQDVLDLKPIVKTEFNIEGNPTPKFIDLVLKVKPHQVTLVPDLPNAITSNAGWDTITHQLFLKEVINEFKKNNIRTSIFIDPVLKYFEPAAKCGTDRVELYTESYAENYISDRENAIKDYISAASVANSLGLGVNAGHDLNLENLKYFVQNIPNLLEVSIGHALVCDALYIGLKKTVKRYLRELGTINNT